MIARAAAVAAALAVLSACTKQDPAPESGDGLPIGFGSATVAGTEAATKAGGVDFGRDFVICGIKTIGSGEQPFVFPGYEVRYHDHSYDYVFGTQSIRYWDTSASSYAFWGYSPKDKAEILISHQTAITSVFTPAQAQEFYYSDVENVLKADYGKQVCMKFGRLGSRVRFGFYETIEGIGISDITFSVSGNFLTTARYTLSAHGVSLSSSAVDHALSASSLPGPLASEKNAMATGRDITAWQPVLPLVDTDITFTIESCTFSQEGSTKTLPLVEPIAIHIPQGYNYWEPNKDYTYVFKISAVNQDFNQIIFGFDGQIIRDWVDNGAETIYDFQP